MHKKIVDTLKDAQPQSVIWNILIFLVLRITQHAATASVILPNPQPSRTVSTNLHCWRADKGELRPFHTHFNICINFNVHTHTHTHTHQCRQTRESHNKCWPGACTICVDSGRGQCDVCVCVSVLGVLCLHCVWVWQTTGLNTFCTWQWGKQQQLPHQMATIFGQICICVCMCRYAGGWAGGWAAS